MIKVFVADMDDLHIRRTREAVDRCSELTFLGSASSGEGAYRQLLRTTADVLILDLQLTGMDGVGLLRGLNRQCHKPVSIICTRLYSDVCTHYANLCGATYLLYKPCDYARLPEVVRECYRVAYPSAPNDQNFIPTGRNDELLTRLGFAPGLRGTLCLHAALDRLRLEPGMAGNLSRELYPEIALALNTTPACVERAMRNAIAIAWDRGDLGSAFSRRPSNREMIDYMLEHDVRR